MPGQGHQLQLKRDRLLAKIRMAKEEYDQFQRELGQVQATCDHAWVQDGEYLRSQCSRCLKEEFR